MEHRRLTGQQTHHDVGGHRGHERSSQCAGREVAAELFEDEDDAGEGRVEGRRQSGAGAGGDQDVPLAGAALEPAAHHLAQGAPHLHGGPFPPEREAAADAEGAAGEFDQQHPPPAHAAQAVENGLEMRDAAAGGLGSEAADEPERGSRAGAADHEHEQQAPGGRHGMGRAEQAIARAVGSLEREPEPGGDQAGEDPDQGGARDDLAPPVLAAVEVADLASDVARGDGGVCGRGHGGGPERVPRGCPLPRLDRRLVYRFSVSCRPGGGISSPAALEVPLSKVDAIR